MNWDEDSETIDRRLGLRVGEIEETLLSRARALDPAGTHHSWGSLLHQGNQTWVGLHPQSILTPYGELARICRELSPGPGELLVDLGAGYGRLGLVLRSLYPGVNFHGIEFVPERVREGQRVFSELGLDPDWLEEGDLTSPDFRLPEAEYFFVYDFGKIPHQRELLRRFSVLADRRRFKLVGRGKGIRSLVSHEFPWVVESHRDENYSIYDC